MPADQQTTPAKTHALERTSPKGGQFIGRCILCGATDLRIGDAFKRCENPMQMTEDQVLVEVING